MSSIAVPGALAPRRAWRTDLPVLLVAVVCFGAREWAGLLFLSAFCTLFAFFV